MREGTGTGPKAGDCFHWRGQNAQHPSAGSIRCLKAPTCCVEGGLTAWNYWAPHRLVSRTAQRPDRAIEPWPGAIWHHRQTSLFPSRLAAVHWAPMGDQKASSGHVQKTLPTNFGPLRTYNHSHPQGTKDWALMTSVHPTPICREA